jgi:hypothetical protein
MVRAASIFRIGGNLEDGSSTASETLLSILHDATTLKTKNH